VTGEKKEGVFYLWTGTQRKGSFPEIFLAELGLEERLEMSSRGTSHALQSRELRLVSQLGTRPLCKSTCGYVPASRSKVQNVHCGGRRGGGEI
jgi:hypothetical protein